MNHAVSFCFPSPTDITLVIQDITSAKPRQRSLPKKTSRRKEITPKDLTYGASSGNTYDPSLEGFDTDQIDLTQEGWSVESEEGKERGREGAEQGRTAEDVPDGAQISKAFDKLCNIVRDRIRSYQKPESKADVYTKKRYVLVSGEGSYEDPCFHSSTVPSKGGISVSEERTPSGVEPIPELPEPPESDRNELEARENQEGSQIQEETRDKHKPEDREKEGGSERQKEPEEREEEPTKEAGVVEPKPPPTPSLPGQAEAGIYTARAGGPLFKELGPPSSMSYEKVEVVESVEKFSDDKIQTYEETAMIVETMIEKTSKKKAGDKSC